MKSNNKDNGIKYFFNENKQIFLIMLCFVVILSIYIFTRYHLPILDEGVYLGMGKAIFSSLRIGFWEAFRPIGLPLILGVGWKLGMNIIVFAKIVSILFGAATLFIIYIIAKKLFSNNEATTDETSKKDFAKKVAILSAILLAITPIFFRYVQFTLTEVPSMFFVLLAIYLILENKYFLAGISSGLAFITKFPQGLFAVVFGVFLIITFFYDGEKTNPQITFGSKFKNKFKSSLKKGALFYCAFLIILFAYFTFNFFLYYPTTTTNLYDATIKPVVAASIFQQNPYLHISSGGFLGNLYSFFYYPISIVFDNSFGCLLYLFFLVFIYLFFKKKLFKDSKHILIVSTLIVYFIYYSSISHKQDRFMHFFVPLAAIYCAYAFYISYRYLFGKQIIKNKSKENKLIKNNTIKNNVIINKNILNSKLNLKSKWKSNTKSAIAIIFILFFLFSLGYVILKDVWFYSWEFKSEPEIVSKFYTYFEKNNIQGAVSTSDPVLIAYADNKILAPADLDAALNGNDYWKIKAAFYADYTTLCRPDEDCVAKRAAYITDLKQRMNATFDLALEGPCYSGICYIFVKK